MTDAPIPVQVWIVETTDARDHDTPSIWTIAQIFTTKEDADTYAAQFPADTETCVSPRPLLTSVPARITNFSLRVYAPVGPTGATVEDVMTKRFAMKQWDFDEVDADGVHNTLDTATVSVTRHGPDHLAVLGKGSDYAAVEAAVRAEVTARLAEPVA